SVVTCMDHRVDPIKIFGLNPGDAHVIRNAGGLTREALRSIIISQRRLGTKHIYVLQHTKCGMLGLSNIDVSAQIIDESPGDPCVAAAAVEFDFKPFPDLVKSVKDNVQFLKHHPLVETRGRIQGYVYDVETQRRPPKLVA
ncbi:carbonic anhydrase, partial [Coniophora puteana RWD-64-598 SS2]